MSIAAVVTAAGSGSRLGADVPKALVPLAGRSLVAWAVLRIADACDEVVVTAPQAHLDEVRHELAGIAALGSTPVTVVAGGADRQQSVAKALDVLFAAGREGPRIVLVHDAARAFQDPSVTAAAIQAIEAGADGAVPIVALVDTLVQASSDLEERDDASLLGRTVNRDSLRAVQTPQVFAGAALRAAHLSHADAGATDDAQLVRASGGRVVAVEGHESGFKVTRPTDLPLAEHLARVLASQLSQKESSA